MYGTPTKAMLMRELMGAPAGTTGMPQVPVYDHEVSDKERRTAMARGILAAAKSIGGSKQDFLAAVGEGIPAGAEAYLNTKDEAIAKGEKQNDQAMEQRRQRALDVLKSQMAIDKDKRAATRSDTQNRLTDARIKDIGTDNARADRAQTVSESREGRISEQAETQAKIDALRLKQLETEVNTGSSDKSALRRKQVEDAVNKQAKLLGLGTDNFMSPEEKAQKEEAVSKYRTSLEKQMGVKPLYGDQAAGAPVATTDWMPEKGVSYTKDNPATPMTKAARDALPKGSVFKNPADGKFYIVK